MERDDHSGLSYEERIAACPIHRWADIDDYLKRAYIPEKYWQPFHELVLERGKYPKEIDDEQGIQFGRTAVAIIHEHHIGPTHAHALRMMFGELIDQWIAEEGEII